MLNAPGIQSIAQRLQQGFLRRAFKRKKMDKPIASGCLAQFVFL